MKKWLIPIKLKGIIKVNGFFKSEGFTLIETLVSMMIIAISLSIIMGLFSGGLKSKRLSEEYFKAVFYSQIKMEALLLSSNNLSIGVEDGAFDDVYSWETEIIEEQDDIASEDSETAANQLFRQYKILLTIKWKSANKEKTFVIQTIKLEPKDKADIG